VLVAYRKFFRALPEPVRRRASHGAAIFVAGALGVELLEWATVASLGGETEQLVDGLVSTVQEFLEMLGVVFILEALVLLLSVDGESIRLRVG
jgi:hypothetical protein